MELPGKSLQQNNAVLLTSNVLKPFKMSFYLAQEHLITGFIHSIVDLGNVKNVPI